MSWPTTKHFHGTSPLVSVKRATILCSELADFFLCVADSIVNAQPVKAEMSVAAPKSQAREPIQLDVILVCRKRAFDARRPEPSAAALARAFAKAVAKAARLGSKGLELSRNDRRVILYSQFLAELGPVERFCRLLPSSSLTSRPLWTSVLCVTQPILG